MSVIAPVILPDFLTSLDETIVMLQAVLLWR